MATFDYIHMLTTIKYSLVDTELTLASIHIAPVKTNNLLTGDPNMADWQIHRPVEMIDHKIEEILFNHINTTNEIDISLARAAGLLGSNYFQNYAVSDQT